MKEIDRPKNLKRFYLSWQNLNHAYEKYAKENGLTYISLFMLQLIDDNTTQKELSETLFFPKQTVNKVIQTFYKQGIINLSENEKDKRFKTISLTEKGKALQEKIIPTINNAELETFDSLTKEEQVILADLWEKYTKICIDKIDGTNYENKEEL